MNKESHAINFSFYVIVCWNRPKMGGNNTCQLFVYYVNPLIMLLGYVFVSCQYVGWVVIYLKR